MKGVERIFSIQSDDDFLHWALKTFHFQYKNCSVYRDFCNFLRVSDPLTLTEIPFLPISFFKTHRVQHDSLPIERIFKSSGTTGTERSQHGIQNTELYRMSFRKTYLDQMGDPKNQVILALLPNYIEQGESSLVFMVDDLVKQTQHPLSGFLLHDLNEVEKKYKQAIRENRDVVIFGVSYALLDLAEKKMDLSKARIIETGGMKGRRKEMTKNELHDILKTGFGVDYISSEYGMTELLSQAYSKHDGLFTLPPWMKIILRETQDPLTILTKEKTGGINVIDLANTFSCSFIATQDLGRMENGKLQLMGRFDHADLRGCNLMVE